jgi:hypothetical protein
MRYVHVCSHTNISARRVLDLKSRRQRDTHMCRYPQVVTCAGTLCFGVVGTSYCGARTCVSLADSRAWICALALAQATRWATSTATGPTSITTVAALHELDARK